MKLLSPRFAILLPFGVLILIFVFAQIGKRGAPLTADPGMNVADAVPAPDDPANAKKPVQATANHPKQFKPKTRIGGVNNQDGAPSSRMTTRRPIDRGVKSGYPFLTRPAAGDPLDIALDFVRDPENFDDFTEADFANPKVSDRYVSRHNEVTHLYLRQQHDGIEVYNGNLSANVMADGSIINLHNGFVSDLASEIQRSEPVLTAPQAIQKAAEHYNLPADVNPTPLSATVVETNAEPAARAQRFSADEISLDPIPTRLVYLAMDDGTTRLAWNTVLRLKDGQRWFDLNVDAESGEVLSEANWISSAEYNVFPKPTESPTDGTRSNVTDPANASSSPYGWHDTDGLAGAEFTDTRGNNVHAQEDADRNNRDGDRPDGGAALDFDFPLDLNSAPGQNLDAANTNLFYWNNLIHDIFWHYGFDEPAGNFQQNNYGNGGLDGDYVHADSQDGSGTNNANFGTPPDGQNPRMQMFIWTETEQPRDSSFDNGVIVHEYGHGITTRLTAGPSNSSGLHANQSFGMGEGWSDFLALALTAKASDTSTTTRGMGNYLLGQSASGPGIRPYRYTVDMVTNPQTYGDLRNNGLSFPHGWGSVWCTTLWEVYWSLVGAHGFDSDLINGNGGNKIALQLVIDGLKLQPVLPSFLDARDAIIMADRVNNGGANVDLLWAAFAKRGMGANAYDGGNPNSRDVIENFELPDALNVSPGRGFTFESYGGPGGPFSPGSFGYQLTNQGTSPLQWTVSTDVNWLDLSATSGTLAAGAGVTVDVIISDNADDLPASAQVATITFTNQTSGRVYERSGTISADYLGEAVDDLTLFFDSGPGERWQIQTSPTYRGGDAARSAPLPSGGTLDESWMETTVQGPDTMTFYWKMSRGEADPSFRFTHAGAYTVFEADEDTGWRKHTTEIPPGETTVRWSIVNNNPYRTGAFLYVDEVVLGSRFPEPTITSSLSTAVRIGQSFSYQIDAKQVIAYGATTYFSDPLPPGLFLDSNTGLISGVPTSTGTWSVDITASNSKDSDTKTLTITVDDLPGSLDAPDLELEHSDIRWMDQTAVTHDGIDAVQSGNIGDNGVSYFEMTVEGPDYVRFLWKVDSEEGSDFLRFGKGYQGSEVLEEISGNVDWTEVEYFVPEGTHVLNWQYVKDGAGSAGVDAGWIDELFIGSMNPQPYITGNLSAVAATYSPFEYQILAANNPTSYSSSALPEGLSLDPVSGLISGQPTVPGDYTITVTASNAEGSGSAPVSFLFYSIGEAIEITDRSVTSGGGTLSGGGEWIWQTETTFDGVDAAQSVFEVGQLGSAFIETTIEGPGELQFQWQVRTNDSTNSLRFLDNGDVKETFNGFKNWSLVTYSIPEGTHVLRWEFLVQEDWYIPFLSTYLPSRAWLDAVEFQRTHPLPDITSSLYIEGPVAVPFSYQIIATEDPVSYSSATLPDGLSLNTETGEISGTPVLVGRYEVDITATSLYRSNTETLIIEIFEPAPFPFTETFESGAFDPVWVRNRGEARNVVTSDHAPHRGNWHATLDTDSGNDTRNEMTVAVDLAGQSNVALSFWAKSPGVGETADGSLSTPYSNGGDFDGVAISADGFNWFEVQPLRTEIDGDWEQFVVDLDAAIATHGLTYNSLFRIRFNHFGNLSLPDGGFAFDTISVDVFRPEIVVDDASATELQDGADTTDFGTQEIGGMVSRTYTIHNFGSETLSGLTATIDGAHPGDFIATPPGSTTLAPGESMPLTVTFAPVGLGQRSATLKIASNDADENPFDIALTGLGISPEIVVEFPVGTGLVDGEGSVDFGIKALASTTSHVVTIRNTGTSTLTGLIPSITGSGAPAYSASAPLSETLAPGESTTFTLTFAPTTENDFPAVLKIASNDLDENPFDIDLEGTGLSPEIVVEFEGQGVSDGGTLLFEEAGDSASPIRLVQGVLRNTGTVPLIGLNHTIDGPDAASFSLPPLNNATLQPGETLPLLLEFDRGEIGELSADLHISSNDVDESPFDISIEVTLLPPIDLESFADSFGLTGAARLALSDDDRDGITLLEELAFNLDPTARDGIVMEPGGNSGLPLICLVDGRLQVEYLRRSNAPELSYVVEFGSVLEAGVSGEFEPATEPETSASAAGNFRRVIVRDSVGTTSHAARFGRVRIIYTPSDS